VAISSSDRVGRRVSLGDLMHDLGLVVGLRRTRGTPASPREMPSTPKVRHTAGIEGQVFSDQDGILVFRGWVELRCGCGDNENGVPRRGNVSTLRSHTIEKRDLDRCVAREMAFGCFESQGRRMAQDWGLRGFTS
jgi:hypothetical protein